MPSLRRAILLAILPFTASSPAMTLNPVAPGTNTTLTGSGGPANQSAELFRNGRSLGSTAVAANGTFSFSGVAASTGDSFFVTASQVWNFDNDGDSQGWGGLGGDSSEVADGIWKQTADGSGDMSIAIYGDGKIASRARVLEVRLRYSGNSGAASVLMQTAGSDGLAGGGDDGSSAILNSFHPTSDTRFQTLLFDLGVDHAGNPTAWLDGSAPVSLTLYIPGTTAGDTLEVESIRLKETLDWTFDQAGDLGEWQATANTDASVIGGVLRLTAIAPGPVAAHRPYRNIDSNHFRTMVVHLRQVSLVQPNRFQFEYTSNPAAYAAGGISFSFLPVDGLFRELTVNLHQSPAYGNFWNAGGAATLNAPQDALSPLLAGAAGEYAEIARIQLKPASTHGPSAVRIVGGTPGGLDYYVSSSSGSDHNTGRDPQHPWATFTPLSNMTLAPGTTVHLKRGDFWDRTRLRLNGKGSPGNPITLTAYGDGSAPRISGINLTTEPCIVWENPSHVRIDSMSCQDAKIGIYLRFTGGNTNGTGAMFNNSDVHITGCHFKNMDEPWGDENGVIEVSAPYELSWGAGIWLGGSIPSPAGGPWPSETAVILDDFSVTHCGFEDVNTGLGTGFYHPTPHRSRFTNFRFEDSWVTGCENGAFALFFVDGGHARRIDTWRGGTGPYSSGTTGGFIQTCRNFLVEDCQFAGNLRPGNSNDGVGFDIEGFCDSITVRNTVIHDNDGAGFLVLNTGGWNSNLLLENITSWNNCRNPYPNDPLQNSDFRYAGQPSPPDPANYGLFTNGGIYLGSDQGTGPAAGQLSPFDIFADWNDDFHLTNVRTGTPWSAISGRPVEWTFSASAEGWGDTNDLAGLSASDGVLNFNTTGSDPWITSPPTWANTRERRWIHVRMSSTAGTLGQIFFQTEHEPWFNGEKSAAFTVVPDGLMRDYIIDLGVIPGYFGVVTRWRLDPSTESEAFIAVDAFSSEASPHVTSITAIDDRTIDLRFNQAMHPDGGVFHPANYQLSGLGQGTAAGQPSTVSMISTTEGPVYRLTWSTGHTNGLKALVSVSNALDARGNPLWNGGPFVLDTVPKPETDTDGDGIPDDWEDNNGLDSGLTANGTLDDDGDGKSNLEEYLAGTDPQNAASRFQVIRLEDVPEAPSHLRVVWASQPGMVYYVEASDSLTPGSWTPLHDDPLVATTAESFWDAMRSGSQRFYRVRAFRPNPLIIVSP